MRPDLQEPLGKEHFLVHREDDDLETGIFFQQIGGETEGFRMRHIDVQHQQIERGRLHFFDDRFPIFSLVDDDIPDTAIDQ